MEHLESSETKSFINSLLNPSYAVGKKRNKFRSLIMKFKGFFTLSMIFAQHYLSEGLRAHLEGFFELIAAETAIGRMFQLALILVFFWSAI